MGIYLGVELLFRMVTVKPLWELPDTSKVAIRY